MPLGECVCMMKVCVGGFVYSVRKMSRCGEGANRGLLVDIYLYAFGGCGSLNWVFMFSGSRGRGLYMFQSHHSLCMCVTKLWLQECLQVCVAHN